MIEYLFKKAIETFAEADFLFAHEYWNTTINKLYYGCYYAVSALLANVEVYPKSHSGTQQMFCLHFIKTGIFENEISDLYTKLIEMRQDADYEDYVDYEKADVQPLFQPARQFVSRIEKLLFPA